MLTFTQKAFRQTWLKTKKCFCLHAWDCHSHHCFSHKRGLPNTNSFKNTLSWWTITSHNPFPLSCLSLRGRQEKHVKTPYRHWETANTWFSLAHVNQGQLQTTHTLKNTESSTKPNT